MAIGYSKRQAKVNQKFCADTICREIASTFGTGVLGPDAVKESNHGPSPLNPSVHSGLKVTGEVSQGHVPLLMQASVQAP